MKRRVKLSPSALSCDFAHAGEQIALAKQGGAEYLHLDVMDGLFVPNISFGQPVVKSLRKCTDLLFDVHLMIEDPARYIEEFASAGADLITIHVEATDDVVSTLKKIKACGVKSGISLKPGTPAAEILPYLGLCDLVLVMTVEPGFGGQKFMQNMLPKVTMIRDYADKNEISLDIGVDGGINAENAPLCVLAGANLLIAGSSVFAKEDIKAAAEKIIRSAMKFDSGLEVKNGI